MTNTNMPPETREETIERMTKQFQKPDALVSVSEVIGLYLDILDEVFIAMNSETRLTPEENHRMANFLGRIAGAEEAAHKVYQFIESKAGKSDPNK
jgi:hypothetical protein